MSELRRILSKYVDASGDPCSVLNEFIVDMLAWHDEVMVADRPMVPLEDMLCCSDVWMSCHPRCGIPSRCPRCGDSLSVVDGVLFCVRCEEAI